MTDAPEIAGSDMWVEGPATDVALTIWRAVASVTGDEAVAERVAAAWLARVAGTELFALHDADRHDMQSKDDLVSAPDSASRSVPLIYYTDGSAVPNPGYGGYGVVLNGEIVASGYEPGRVSNNRMEGRAILAAIEHSGGRPAVIMTDSELWMKALTERAPRWEARG